MQLTSENYYSQEANQEYMSVSGYKDFAGTYGKMPCEFYGMEKLNGRWEDEKSTALLVGSYVDSYFEGSLEQFKKDNPEIFTQKGELKANFKQAEEIIARIERDEYFMKYMSGQKQVIMTGELFGAKWKIKMDSYIPGEGPFLAVDGRRSRTQSTPEIRSITPLRAEIRFPALQRSMELQSMRLLSSTALRIRTLLSQETPSE